jgi:hypothetical protein
MANLTRILNNQITNSTIIASQKIQAGSIVGSLFASNITVPGDILVTGNLFVLGTSQQTTIASTNTYVNDPLLTLNNGFSGTNTYDEGLVFNRGSATNTGFFWSEAFKEFRVVYTTETGTTYGNINATGLANLSVGNFVATGITTINNVVVSTLAVTGNVIGGLAQFAALNSTPIGNATPSTGNFTYAIAGNVLSGFIGNTGTVFTGASLNVSGNVLASTINATTENLTTLNAGSVNAVTIGNAGATVTGTTAAFSGNVIGGLAQFAAINNTPIGNATASTGAFTTLSAANNLWANASIATTTQGTGAIVVPNGGISVSGAANVGSTLTVAGATQLNSTLGVGGIVTLTNTTNSSEATGSSGALQIKGGASIAQDLWVGGNLFVSNIIGVQANIITVTDPLLYLRNSNISVYNYDIGFYSAFTGTGLGSINQYQHTAVFRNPLNNTWTFASNLAEPSASYINIDGTTVYDPIKAGNLQLTVTTDSTNTTSGALIVGGGAGIGGNIFISGPYVDSSSSSFVHMPTPTAANNFSAATTIFYGAAAGDFTIRNPNINSVQSTLNLFRGNVTTLNFATSATTISMGGTTGTTTLNSVTNGATYRAGALVVGGGVGVNGNLNLSRNNVITLGADWNSNVVYPENAVQITANSNATSRISIQNINSGSLSASEFYAQVNNGSNVAGGASFGIAGINSTAGALKPGDAYIQVTNNGAGGGNIFFAAVKDVLFTTNSNAAAVGVRISGAFANLGVQYSTPATSSTTGALTSVGGISTQANLYVAKGAVINSTNGIEGFTVNSSTSGNVAIFANVVGTAGTSTTEYVVIGGSNLAVQTGVVLKVGGQTSMMVPVGPQAARPSSQGGVDVAGMLRFNSSSNLLEYYDGSMWQVAGSSFTVISDRQFSGNVAGGYGNVDGTNTIFTIQSNATTASTLVSINGVVQFPTLAYSISGATLTFTEPPAPSDVIDVRVLTTTATVSSIANGNGVNQLVADDTGVSVYSGTGSTIQRILVDTAGNFNLLNGTHQTYTQSNVNIASTATPIVIDTFTQTKYSTAKYIVQAKVNGTNNFESYEAMVMTDQQGNAYISTYGVVNNGTSFGALTANVVAGNVNVYYTSTRAQANVKAFGTYIV